MTVQEAAKLLEVSTGTVYTLCRAGKLAHTRLGLGRGTIRIDRADIEALKMRGRVEVEEPKAKTRGRRSVAPPMNRDPWKL